MRGDGRPLTLFGITCRNLYRQPLRTSLTALGVAVGVVAVVAFGSVARGLWASTNAAIHFGAGDMIVFQAGVAADIFSTLDEEKTRSALLADPDVADAAATLWHIMPAEGHPFLMILGLHQKETLKHKHHLVRGRPVESIEDEVIIGTIAERLLHKSIGDEIRLARRTFRIVGVFETDVVYFNGCVVMAMQALQKLLHREGKVTSFQVTVRPGADAAAVARRIEEHNPGLFAVASAEQYKKVDQGLEIANDMVWAVSFLAIVIGSMIVTNTMWMTVHERTREIGILRAVGWARRTIVVMIMIESAGVGLIAFVVGCLLGVGLTHLSTRLPVMAQFLEPAYSSGTFLIALTVAVVLSVLGGVLPAWRAARISPVEALRHE